MDRKSVPLSRQGGPLDRTLVGHLVSLSQTVFQYGGNVFLVFSFSHEGNMNSWAWFPADRPSSQYKVSRSTYKRRDLYPADQDHHVHVLVINHVLRVLPSRTVLGRAKIA
jgi:hypothetical protein